jgi:hypothetical protein
VTPAEIVQAVTRLGGRVTVNAGKLRVQVPQARPDLLEALREHRDAVLGYLETEERSSHITRLEPEPLESGLTVWDLLRSDWPTLLEVIRDAQDSEGSITVYAPDGGGEIQPVRLDRTSVLTATLKNLTVRHPDPLEVVVYALKGGRTVLRSRQRRTMVPSRVIA